MVDLLKRVINILNVIAMIKKLLVAVTLCVASVVSGFAQTRTIEHEYSEFTSVVASNGFHVNLVKDDIYATRLTVDDALESYVQCYVKAKTLYIGLDEKSIPKDLKKSYKGKNTSDPTLVVTVYAPSINALTLSSDATFSANFTISVPTFDLNLADNCSVENLSIDAPKSVNLTISKKAKMSSLDIKTGRLEVSASGNGIITGQISVDALSVISTNSAEVSFTGNMKNSEINASGSSKILLTGRGDKLAVSGKGVSAKVDASGLSVDEATVDVAGLSVFLNADKSIELNLEKASEVQYSGDPDIEIVKVLNSSITRK